MIRKIKVLECIRQGQIGGGESHLLSLVKNLDRSLFEPVVLSFTEGPMIDHLKKLSISHHIIPTTKPFDIGKWKAVKKFIRDQAPDLIHAHGTRASSNVFWAAKSLGIPLIYTIHGWSFHPDQKKIVQTIRILGEKYLTSKSDLNISVSASNQQSGKNFIKSFHSIVINNGIDLNKFDPQKKFKNIRKELKISENEILILFIARFTSHKQPLSLIRAFAKALPLNSQLKLLMVGDGDQKKDAANLINELGLREKIILQPFRLDVQDVLAAADIFVLPSLWEGLPIGLLEALSMGKAVIATNVDGTKEIIQHGENGFLIETDHLISNLSNALVELSKNSNLRKKFRQKAIDTIGEKYNAVNMTRKIESVYSEVSRFKQLNLNKWNLQESLI